MAVHKAQLISQDDTQAALERLFVIQAKARFVQLQIEGANGKAASGEEIDAISSLRRKMDSLEDHLMEYKRNSEEDKSGMLRSISNTIGELDSLANRSFPKLQYSKELAYDIVDFCDLPNTEPIRLSSCNLRALSDVAAMGSSRTVGPMSSAQELYSTPKVPRVSRDSDVSLSRRVTATVSQRSISENESCMCNMESALSQEETVSAGRNSEDVASSYGSPTVVRQYSALGKHSSRYSNESPEASQPALSSPARSEDAISTNNVYVSRSAVLPTLPRRHHPLLSVGKAMWHLAAATTVVVVLGTAVKSVLARPFKPVPSSRPPIIPPGSKKIPMHVARG